ncbi:type II toxin-antitoxin system VapC family toxin [Humibacter sp.]|uniref:type II toxin-antitoxin system VapC family toxin n=1 Tax=Humibacter sp. TaxID=1940291 RepID=UPI003F7D3AF7
MSLVLVGTSVWIDHLHRSDKMLVPLLEANLVVGHPLVIGELALGSIRERATVLELLARLPQAPEASNDEVLTLIENRHLFGKGLSIVDLHLLASVLVAGDVRLFTRDRRLSGAADDAGVRWTG